MFHLQSEHFGVCSNGEASNPWVHFIRKSFKSSGFLLKHHTHPGLWKKLRTHSNNLDICNMRRGCKCRLKSRNNLQNSCKILGLPKWPKIIRHASVIYIYIFFFYRADSTDAGPVRFLVHSGCLVELTEEEVDLLLELYRGRDYGGASKLGIWVMRSKPVLWDSVTFMSLRHRLA